jgi:hypothetical protein
MKKKLAPGDDSREIRDIKRVSGRWPDYAIEITKLCAASNGRYVLKEPLGDCRKDQMPKEVIDFLDRRLEPALRRQPNGAAQWDALKKAEGHWPDYPKMIVDLAKQLNEPIPGWTLPGPRNTWDRFRPNKGKLK